MADQNKTQLRARDAITQHAAYRLTPEITARIVDAYRVLGNLTLAAQCAGVGKATIYRWIRSAERDDPDGLFAAFARDLAKSRAEFLEKNINRIERAADNDWKAAANLVDRVIENPDPDVGREVWDAVSDDDAVAEVAKDPRVIAAVLAAQAKALGSGGDGQ